MANNPLKQLIHEGTSVWLDYLSRTLVDSGKLKKFIDDDGLRGETSNPTIFQKAITDGNSYSDAVRDLGRKGLSAEEIVWELMVRDIQHACDVFRPFYEETRMADGYVSLEINPTLAHDTAASLKQAHELTKRVDRPNVMYKVPAMPESLPVIEELIYEGFNVNVTLLFDIKAHDAVIEAYLKGLERRVAEHKPIGKIASVASFFVSRVDSETDKRLDEIVKSKPELKAKADAVRGKVAVANARLAYELFEQKFHGPRWAKLAVPRRLRAAPAVGLHRHQEQSLLRRAVRRRADRPALRQHHAGDTMTPSGITAR